MMTHADFIRLVKAMRFFQKRYFRERTPSLLNECKRMEADVDAALAAFERPETPAQGRLFDPGREVMG